MALAYQACNTARTRRPDKALRRHPAISAVPENCLMALRLSGL